MMLKIATLAPMPSPSVKATVKVNPGFLRSIRMPTRTSWINVSSIGTSLRTVADVYGSGRIVVQSQGRAKVDAALSWPLTPPSYERQHGHATRIELAGDRRIRDRNKVSYRLAHWPIWIFVFFIAPGPLTFDLFESGFDRRMALWLGAVLIGTGIAGLRGRLPGVEPRPYIIRFTEDRPNPLYRRVCYTLAWS